MNNQQFINHCLKMKGAYIDFPFGENVLVVKVKKKIFAQAFLLKGIETVTLNCSADGGVYYRCRYPNDVTRGYHCPPVQQPYFNSFSTEKLSDDIILDMINHSYQTVLSKLPKYIKAEFL